MNNYIENHFEKLLTGEIKSAFADYSRTITCIADVNGKSQTLTGKHAAHLIWNLGKVLGLGTEHAPETLVRRSTEEYGVLTLKSSIFAPFISYTCIVKNGEIAYFTLYVSNPSCNILPKQTASLPEGKEAKKLFYKHVRAMFSMSANVITKDYAEYAVVITNMSKDICDGKSEIYLFCDNLMKSCWKIIRKLRPHSFSPIKWKTKSIDDGLMLFVCEAKAFNTVMTETYWTENGKIQFESSICSGDMPKLVQKIVGQKNFL